MVINKSLNEIVNSISSMKEFIKKEYRAQIVGIFGSFIRGEEKETSDIDILVEFEEEADLFDFVGLSIFLEEKLGRKVDVVPRDTIRPELKDVILKEALPV